MAKANQPITRDAFCLRFRLKADVASGVANDG